MPGPLIARALAVCGAATRDLLQDVVRRQLPVLADHLLGLGRSLLRWQRRALEAFASCSDPHGGFALLRCGDCDRSKVVPFTCAVRGLCGTCGGRVMSQRAARWVDDVLPRAPVRQWVLSLPWPRRYLLARRPDLCRGVLGVVLEVVFRWYARRSEELGGRQGSTGSVTVIQRFSSSLALNLHYHMLVIDGAYVEHADGGISWQPVPAPTTEEVQELVVEVATRVECWLGRRGFGAEEPVVQDEEDDEPLLAAAVAGRAALGERAGCRTRRVRQVAARPFRLPPLCGEHRGYNLHAAVSIAEHDRSGLERICRYVNRPPLAKARLHARPDGLLELDLGRPWADGTTSLIFSELELAQRVVALLPPPRANQVLYHGVLGARSRLRAKVVPQPQHEPEPSRGPLRNQGEPRRSTRWMRWSDLMWRVFLTDGFACECGGRMNVHAVVLPPATLDVLESLARGPPASRPPCTAAP